MAEYHLNKYFFQQIFNLMIKIKDQLLFYLNNLITFYIRDEIIFHNNGQDYYNHGFVFT